jgi:hypothetical protein
MMQPLSAPGKNQPSRKNIVKERCGIIYIRRGGRVPEAHFAKFSRRHAMKPHGLHGNLLTMAT